MKEEVKRTDAKILVHCAFIALGLACVVYGVVGFISYRDLLAHQPSATHPTNAPDTTSCPPWAAWFYAAFPAALSLPVGFVFSLIIDFAVTVYRNRQPRNPMNSSSHIIHPGARENPRAFEVQERTKIARELQEKCADELLHASWWKGIWIRLKIWREAACIYRHRLYLTPKMKPLVRK